MSALQLIHMEVLLVYIFAMYREVSAYTHLCGSYVCYDSFCCMGTCCYPNIPDIPDMPGGGTSGDGQLPWTIPVTIFGVAAGIMCLMAICFGCYRLCKKSGQPVPQRTTRNPPIPTAIDVSVLPTAPSFVQSIDPPPYSEVVGKPYFDPVPMGQPPCYENYAMEDLPSLHITRHPESVPNNNS